MSGGPVQRAVRAVDAGVRTAFLAMADHSLGCTECKATRDDTGLGCPTGTELYRAWSRARRGARR
ncbi:hypothetical protein [Streptomyces sp. NPDC002328]|uniref:hypothetical protein n=1 Tax=Streptomyces sp. NPDC002328 TaxID=3364642 RepID=UPI003688C11E